MNDGLYPELEPHTVATLSRPGHDLYYEISGRADGPTALFLPGSTPRGNFGIRKTGMPRRSTTPQALAGSTHEQTRAHGR